MKKFYSILVVFLCFSVNAQIVNIPDPVFKSDLINYNGVDTNADGEIQVSEAQVVSFIQIISTSIASFEGIQSFTNLNNFSLLLGNSFATTMNLSALTQLTYLELPSCTALTNITLNAPSLTVLKITNTALTSINLTLCNSLQTVDLSNNQIATIQMPSNATNTIYELNLRNNLLTNFSCPSVLGCALDLSYNQLTTFNTPLNYCETVDLSNNQLTSINFLAIQNITNFYLINNPFTTLDLTGFVFGQLFNGSGPNLSYVKIPSYQNSSVASLYNSVYISGPNLNVVDFKNGSCDVTYGISGIGWPDPIRWYISGSPNLFFCVDDLGCDAFPSRNEEFFFSHLNIIYTGSVISDSTPPTNYASPYCTFTPGGGFNTVSGNIKWDCGSSNVNLSNVKMYFNIDSQNELTFSNNQGNYWYYVGENNTTVSPQFENPSYFTVTPPNYNYNFTTTGNTQVADFCIAPNGVHPDLEIKIVPVIRARPGFDATYDLVYKNKGNQTQSGSVALTFNDAVIDYVSANPTTSSQATNTLNWNFTALAPFESRTIQLTLNANSPMETPAVNNGDILPFIASVVAPETDETPANNSFSFNQTVIGSFDPNDKQVVEGPQIDISRAGDYLTYVVRFQNTGTSAADNVVVKDILSSNLNWNSLEIVDASHPFRSTLSNGNKLEFFFEGINLPASSINEPASHGYISFKIKPKNTVVIGSIINNKASIYFDYNFPIATNTATTTFATLSTTDFDFGNYFNLYPNPASNTLNINAKDTIVVKSIAIYNTLGQLVMSIPNAITTATISMDISNLKTGLYFVSVATDKGKTTQRFVKE